MTIKFCAWWQHYECGVSIMEVTKETPKYYYVKSSGSGEELRYRKDGRSGYSCGREKWFDSNVEAMEFIHEKAEEILPRVTKLKDDILQLLDVPNNSENGEE